MSQQKRMLKYFYNRTATVGAQTIAWCTVGAQTIAWCTVGAQTIAWCTVSVSSSSGSHGLGTQTYEHTVHKCNYEVNVSM